MKSVVPILFCLLSCALPAMAQDKVVAATGGSATLDLYAQPGAEQPLRQISVAEAGLPLTIEAKKTGFYQVAIGGQSYWLRGSRVRISRGTTAQCGAVAQNGAALTAATPGAVENACK